VTERASSQLAILAMTSLALVLIAVGCRTQEDKGPSLSPPGTFVRSEESYQPDRRDYATFAASMPDLLEPNYLPFMAHRFFGDDAEGDPVVLCRWDETQMPLRARIDAPEIPDSLQDEFHPASAEQYRLAAERALQTWERALEGLVRFTLVEGDAPAQLVLRVVGEVAPSPAPDVRVLGETGGILDACRPEGWDEDSDRLRVRFEVPELVIYMADRHGPLTPHQVELIALHELGHALGMKGHSPMPSDLMYPILQDGPAVERLSTQDVNSFVSLYRVPNGTRYTSVPEDYRAQKATAGPPSGGPRLSLAPHVDTTHGFELRPPEGWMRVSDKHGFFAANGPTWDHDVSIEVFVWPSPTLDAFLARFGSRWLGGLRLLHQEPIERGPMEGLFVEVETPGGERRRHFHFLETGDDRVLLFLADLPGAHAEAWLPWLEAALASLEIWTEQGGRAGPPLRE